MSTQVSPKDALRDLTNKKDVNGALRFLSQLDKQIKGPIFEWYLAELYKANGWISDNRGGHGDAGGDILLYHPKTPGEIFLIVQAKNHNSPLTVDQTRNELVKFEQDAAPLYACQQFNLVSVSGFVKNAKTLGDLNMLLSDWEYVANLIRRAHTTGETPEPEIELYAHNQAAYESVNRLWEGGRLAAVIQATGTGKSFIIAKLLADHLDRHKVVLAPSRYILRQQANVLPWIKQSTTFMTYAKCAALTKVEIEALAPALIVLDEFHRCGAEVWGPGVVRLIEAHPEARVLGTTATPIRYLDSSRDMSGELFEGRTATNLSLAEAITRRILPVPTYVTALYTLDEETVRIEQAIAESNVSDEAKETLRREISDVKVDWESSSGIPEILRKYLNPEISKVIVFCRDLNHLDGMEVEVNRWFQKAGIFRWRKTYRVVSADSESDSNLAAFEKASSRDTVHLLFAIDILNEGLHVPGVGAVMLLRPTESPTVFYQQLGRCIKVGPEQPIILDLVNNFQSIHAIDFQADLEQAIEREGERRRRFGLGAYHQSVRIDDETKSIVEVFGDIQKRLKELPWQEMFVALRAYADAEDHARVPIGYVTSDGKRLGKWVSRLRGQGNDLAQEKRAELESLPGWSWNIAEDVWQENLAAVRAYAKTEGHARVPQTHVTSDGIKLGSWVVDQRKNQHSMAPEKRARLESVPGWSWNPLEDVWQESFEMLRAYAEAEGHARVSQAFVTPDGVTLGSWVSRQRKNRHSLSAEKCAALESLPRWSWDPVEDDWQEAFAALRTYAKVEGHARVPIGYVTPDGAKLGIWVSTQRRNWESLAPEKRTALESLPRWSRSIRRRPKKVPWEESFAALRAYAEAEGHARVPARHVTHDDVKLGKWVSRQRGQGNDLAQEKRAALESLPGWSWDISEDDWQVNFAALRAYAEAEGHARVPGDYVTPDGTKLGIWVSNLRRNWESLAPEKRTALESLPRWSRSIRRRPKKVPWEESIAALRAYAEAEGHARTPKRYVTPDGVKLGTWLHSQRRKRDALTSEQRAALESLPGWTWTPLEDEWQANFAALRAYAEAEGHARVPARYVSHDGIKLGLWVSRQRHVGDALTPEKRAELESLPGWVWTPLEDVWQEMFVALRAYADAEDHARVPIGYVTSDGKRLGKWVSRLRGQGNDLAQEKRAELESLPGWSWNIAEDVWQENLAAVRAYAETEGHARVPIGYVTPDGAKLGIWVSTQRRNWESLAPEKRTALESLPRWSRSIRRRPKKVPWEG